MKAKLTSNRLCQNNSKYPLIQFLLAERDAKVARINVALQKRTWKLVKHLRWRFFSKTQATLLLNNKFDVFMYFLKWKNILKKKAIWTKINIQSPLPEQQPKPLIQFPLSRN